MHKLSIPVLGLALVCAFAGPISSIASAATYGHLKRHTMQPKITALRFHSRFNTPPRYIIASSHRRAIRFVSPVGAHLK